MDLNHTPETLINLLNNEITPFAIHDSKTFNHILEKIGDSRIVLMGEASHGTSEFYEARIELSKYLIEEKGFDAIAVECDWTSALPVIDYLYGDGDPNKPINSLHDFTRFPSWMWRNETIPPFLQWLRTHNDNLEQINNKVGFYGLDLYCLNSSINAVINYLNKNDKLAAKKAVNLYSCFDHLAVDPQNYGYLVESGAKHSCTEDVTKQLLEMQQITFEKLHSSNKKEVDQAFYASQNARVVKNAEQYYRSMFNSRAISWNVRDRHMAETVQNIIAHIETKKDKAAKIIIWAHNSHIGDARATEMSDRDEINLGQLVREQFAGTSYHLGFSTYTGTVTAANDWGEPAECKIINPGASGSFEEIFHDLKTKNFFLDLHLDEHLNHLLELSRLQRAIGVIYRPETERMSHYFFTHLPKQFDAIIHFDKTNAVKPL